MCAIGPKPPKPERFPPEFAFGTADFRQGGLWKNRVKSDQLNGRIRQIMPVGKLFGQVYMKLILGVIVVLGYLGMLCLFSDCDFVGNTSMAKDRRCRFFPIAEIGRRHALPTTMKITKYFS